MIVLYLAIIAALSMWGSKVSFWNDTYIERDQTTSINGLFILIVFLSHARGYVDTTSYFDIGTRIYMRFFATIGQMMVVMFLFYSGFGLMEQYKTKRGQYAKHFAKKRILKTWIHFVVALIPFAVLSIIMGKHYDIRTYVLSLIGWQSIGNSYWYIFDILALYILFFISMKVSIWREVHDITFCLIMFFLTALFWIFLYNTKAQQRWWYDTILVLPIGCLFSCKRQEIESFVMASQMRYFSVLVAMSILFVCFYHVSTAVSMSVASILFSLIVTAITMSLKVNNMILNWLGRHLFEIYIYQRIPMIVLHHCGMDNAMLFILISLLLTLLIAALMERVYKRIDKAIGL